MDEILNEEISHEELQKFEEIYKAQLTKKELTPKAQFEYAWCLVRSKYSADIKKGIMILENLYESHIEGRRDYLYYLAIGNARIKEYRKSLDFIKAFLSIEPGNQQVLQLQSIVNKRMQREGITGIVTVSGSAIALAALIAVGVKILKK